MGRHMPLGGYLLLEIGLAVTVILGAGYFGARGVSHWLGEGTGVRTRARMAAPGRAATEPVAALPAGAGAAAAARFISPSRALSRREDLSSESSSLSAATASALGGRSPTWDAPGTFLGMSDDILLERMRSQPVNALKLNRGGSSLSFRLDFADGSRAAWKPSQTNTQTVPRKEVAAYRLNRLLGLNVVPPATTRAIAKDDLFGLLHPDSLAAVDRIRAETIVGPSGMVSGAASYWIPVIKDSLLDTPGGHQVITTWLTQGGFIPFADRAMAAQLSTLALFDFITANPDRHSGGNMKTSADGALLFFMDNTMSFFIDPEGTEKNRHILLRTQKFSQRLIEALPRITAAKLRTLMRDADGAEMLTDPEIRTVVQRRDYAQRYIEGLRRQFGDAQVLCFP